MKFTTSQIFEAAAERILTGEDGYCCDAIGVVVGYYPKKKNEKRFNELKEILFDFFNDLTDVPYSIWGDVSIKRNKESRVIGLLLLAEIYRK